MTTTAAQATEYRTGYLAAQTAIAALEATIATEQMRTFAAQNIIPVHVNDASFTARGQSDAWGDWQAAQRLAARRGGRA